MAITDLPGFYPEIKDGGLGALPSLNVSVFGIIGVSSKGTNSPLVVSDINKVVEEYEMGTLVEHLLDAFACGARQVVVLRANASVAGQVGTPTLSGSGTATVSTGLQTGVSNPKADRKWKIKIIGSGTFDDVKYKISNNGGITWSEEKTFEITNAGPPRESQINLEDGTYIKFVEDSTTPSNSFVDGDEYTWENTEAKMSNTDLSNALDTLCAWKDSNGIGLPFIYVAASGDDTVWAVLGSKADEIWNNEQRPVWFLINSQKPDYSAIDTWISNLVSQSQNYRHSRVAVNAFYGRLLDPRGNILVRAGGGCIAGLIAKAKLHWSIGWVREMVLPNCVGIEPYNSESDQMDLSRISQLNDARFITARHFPGYGYVPTDDWMMAPATSDFFCIRNRRIMDASITGVQLANMPFINSPGVAKEDMVAYKQALERPLNALKAEGSIMDYTLTLTPADDIWTSGIVYATIEIVPTPTKKKLVATFQLKVGKAASA